MFLKELHNKYKDAGIFALFSGPSLSLLPLTSLKGKYTFSQKIIPVSHYMTDFWLCMEKQMEIPWQIFEDRKLVKFFPDEFKEKGYIRPIDSNSERKVFRTESIKNTSNNYFFPLNNSYNSAEYFTQPDITWGCDGNMIDEHGLKGRRSIMLATFRLLYHLGFRRIYLCGVDFKMDHACPYCYNVSKAPAAVEQNNILYETLIIRFTALLPYFQERGLQVYNCNPDSNLKVFPFISFQDALNDNSCLHRN